MPEADPARRGRTARSLTRRVLRNVLWPLALSWSIGTGVAGGVAHYLTGQAFDHAMLDDALAMSANIQPGERGPELRLSPRELNTLLFDQVEEVHFAVLASDGSRIAGEAGLVPLAPEPGTRFLFSDIRFEGKPFRAVMLRQEDPAGHSVVIAQTTRGRAALIERLLLYTLAPQLLLLGMLAVWLWRRIRSDLRPLVDLQEALDRRDADDLAPVPVVRTSREVEGLGDAVNSLFDRLGHSVQAQRQFTGNVAHELRTPLAGIRALAEYGLAHPDPAVWREQLERVASSEARASHMVDQLLAIALADEAHATQQRAPVRLAGLVEQTVLRHLARADARGVDLGARGIEEGASVVVQSNAALIEGVLDNLIDNALRYGGRTITVELAGTVLSVIDDGPGIPQEARRDLMQRWAQGAAGQKLGEGAGLGLSIVSRYAGLLGAVLTLESDAVTGGLRASVAFQVQSG
ncbi:sensor histidine kinase N-terminal domain-containing protein [Variovorax rhizosphaerae]|uniref:histidine kinase n=1 Tax=Variovorax rhizosphaerae TaxID=1836200 RepID=A0ABU8WCZ1_9BURK